MNRPIKTTEQLPAAPQRPADAHKGTFGSVLLVGGSLGMSGAAALAGQAALHGGAGLVTVAVPQSILSTVAMLHRSYMTIPLIEDGNGRIAARCIPQLTAAWAGKTAVAVGPGLGQSEGVRAAVRYIYRACPLPLVLDADGLNAFAEKPTALSQRDTHAPRILTPHPGEFARITGLSVASILADREQTAVSFAFQQRVILLLKGAQTIITDGESLCVNRTGNSGMATGGSGDVLTGLIAALLAQGMACFDAAQLGAYLHGAAGDLAAVHHSERYFTSTELVSFLDQAWQQFCHSS